jgi:hypothetical protein
LTAEVVKPLGIVSVSTMPIAKPSIAEWETSKLTDFPAVTNEEVTARNCTANFPAGLGTTSSCSDCVVLARALFIFSAMTAVQETVTPANPAGVVAA